MKINELEESRLRELYEQANQDDLPESWNLIRLYYKQLGKKYGFDPRRVMINTKGEVSKKTQLSIYVVHNTQQSIPVAAYYSKEEAMEHSMDDPLLHWDEVSLV